MTGKDEHSDLKKRKLPEFFKKTGKKLYTKAGFHVIIAGMFGCLSNLNIGPN